jgi:micrococcal nuclease
MPGSARRAATFALAALAPAALAVARAPEGLATATVVRVVDGDTVDVLLAGGRTRVRLIGVDAPEVRDGAKLDRDALRSGRSRAAIRALGRDASDFTRRRLLGRRVGLEFDVERRDRYGRLLAYVWLDGALFNAELVRTGKAQVMTVPPNLRHQALLRRLQREARAAGRGFWAGAPAR